MEALLASGVPEIPDHTAPGAVGVAQLPVNVLDGVRMSTALTYLEPARSRANLIVHGSSEVTRIAIRNRRAVGVELSNGDVVTAGEVILSAGAYASPRLLRASGVAAPGVGANLIDHPSVSIDLPYYGPTEDVARYQLVATLHSSFADPVADAPDLQIMAGGPFSPETPGEPARFFVGAALLKPRSRGRVGDTRIDLNYFDVPGDLSRLAEGVERIEAVLAAPEIKTLTRGERVTPRITQAQAADWIKANAWSYHHPVGTCALGAVVDEQCRVIEIEGLSVVDASVLPDIPSANTHLPTIMVAEHAVALRART
jgi:choline dehydrogenase